MTDNTNQTLHATSVANLAIIALNATSNTEVIPSQSEHPFGCSSKVNRTPPSGTVSAISTPVNRMQCFTYHMYSRRYHARKFRITNPKFCETQNTHHIHEVLSYTSSQSMGPGTRLETWTTLYTTATMMHDDPLGILPKPVVPNLRMRPHKFKLIN